MHQGTVHNYDLNLLQLRAALSAPAGRLALRPSYLEIIGDEGARFVYTERNKMEVGNVCGEKD